MSPIYWRTVCWRKSRAQAGWGKQAEGDDRCRLAASLPPVGEERILVYGGERRDVGFGLSRPGRSYYHG